MATTRKSTARGRFYETPDGIFPSVTNILSVIGKPALINWAANTERELVLDCSANLYEDCHGTPKMSRMAWLTTLQARLGNEKAHKKELEKAGEIGTQVHGLIEWTLRCKLLQKVGPSPVIGDKAQWAYMVFEDWAKRVNLKPILIEQTVYSKTHRYAGTMDLLAEVEGKLTVVDFKTGKSCYPESHLQSAAYRTALREMNWGDAERGVIVRLPKNESDPEAEMVEADSETDCFATFLAVKRLWEFLQARDKYLAEKEKNEILRDVQSSSAA